MTLQLYFAPSSSSLAPLVALEEIGIPYVGRRLDLGAGDQLKPDYLKVNPSGHLPISFPASSDP